MALWIIWCEPKFGVRHTLAAGGASAMRAAWDALQTENPDDTLIMQSAARVIEERQPIR